MELVFVLILGLVELWIIYDIFLIINGLLMYLRKKRVSGLNNVIYISKNFLNGIYIVLRLCISICIFSI